MTEQPCAFHPDRLTGVTCSRCGRPICPDDMFPAPVGIHCPVCAGKMREGPLGQTGYRLRARAERHPLGRLGARAQVTTVILAVNVTVFVLMLATGAPTSGLTLYRFGALPQPLAASQWWRLFTSMFVHVGLAHIAFNMIALAIFGPSIEERYGKVRFLGLYLGGGLLGGAFSLAFSNAFLSAGASGAIFAVMGAWLVIVLTHPSMRDQARGWIFLIGLNLFFSATTPGISLSAHVGGLVAGVLIGGGLETAVRFKGRARTLCAASGFVAVAVLAYALVAANVV